MKKRIVSFLLILVIVCAPVFVITGCSGDEKEVYVEYIPGDVFTVNVHESNRILKCGIVLVLNKEGLEDMLDANRTRIRDRIIFILRDLNEDDVRRTGTQDDLRERIIEELNEMLDIENIVEVIFNDYVMG